MKPRVIGLALIAAFIAAITLTSSPRLHEQLHPFAQHECAVTMISSGSCEHQAPAAIQLQPDCGLTAPVYPSNTSQGSCAQIPSSILEHAPPCGS